MRLTWSVAVLAIGFSAPPTLGQQPGSNQGIWAARDTTITLDGGTSPVRIGIWDSGVDTTLFADRLSRDVMGAPLVRGYDPFKRRQDTYLAVLDSVILAKRDTLNAILQAFDDLDSEVMSPRASALAAALGSMTPDAERELGDEIGLWSAYTHGTAVADIAIAGNDRAEIVIARMEWWHGDPPVPCWSRELADREAESIADLLRFLVQGGARVVNMSWMRAKSSYLGNLTSCAPGMAPEERDAIAQYTVDTIRSVLRAGMAASPGVLFVGAAGNAGSSLSQADQATRFSLPNFLLVGAVGHDGSRIAFTNTGDEVTLYANGFRVPARLPGGVQSYPSGTSMAAPNVTNAAGKMLAVNPQLNGAEVREILEQSADLNATGDRLLNAGRAVLIAQSRRR